MLLQQPAQKSNLPVSHNNSKRNPKARKSTKTSLKLGVSLNNLKEPKSKNKSSAERTSPQSALSDLTLLAHELTNPTTTRTERPNPNTRRESTPKPSTLGPTTRTENTQSPTTTGKSPDLTSETKMLNQHRMRKGRKLLNQYSPALRKSHF